MAQYIVPPNIKGNVTTKGFEGAIHVKFVQHANERFVQQKPGVSNCKVGIVNMDHLQLTKTEDNASAQLYQAFYKGTVIPKVEITRCSILSSQAQWQSKMTLTNVMVSSTIW